MRYSAKFIRLGFSATLGAIWSVLCLLIPIRLIAFERLITYLIITPLMVSVIAWDEVRKSKRSLVIRKLLKGSITLLTVTFLFAGIMQAVRCSVVGYYFTNVLLRDYELLVFVVLTAIIIALIIVNERKIRLEESFKRRVKLSVCGETFEIWAIVDSGNCLTDALTKKPVTVVNKAIFNNILNDINNLYKLQYHFISFNSVGNKEGVLEVITAENMHIYQGEKEESYTNVAIGLSKSPITGDGEYEALLNVAYKN